MRYENIPVNKTLSVAQESNVTKFLHERAKVVLGHKRYEIVKTDHKLGLPLINIGWRECLQ